MFVVVTWGSWHEDHVSTEQMGWTYWWIYPSIFVMPPEVDSVQKIPICSIICVYQNVFRKMYIHFFQNLYINLNVLQDYARAELRWFSFIVNILETLPEILWKLVNITYLVTNVWKQFSKFLFSWSVRLWPDVDLALCCFSAVFLSFLAWLLTWHEKVSAENVECFTAEIIPMCCGGDLFWPNDNTNLHIVVQHIRTSALVEMKHFSKISSSSLDEVMAR